MVVSLIQRIGATLFLLSLPAALAQTPPPARFVPSDLPCASTLTFKLSPTPNKSSAVQPNVTIAGRIPSSNQDAEGALQVYLTPDTDCGKSLRIEVQGAPPQIFKIAAAPAKDDTDVQKSLATYFGSHALEPANANFTLYSLIAAVIAALCGLVLIGWTWLIQSNAKAAQRARGESLARGKSVKELVEDLGENLGKLKQLPANLGKITDKVDKLVDNTSGLATKVNKVMEGLATLKQTSSASIAESVKPSSKSSFAAAPSNDTSRSSYSPTAPSFADSYNAALAPLGQEASLPGVRGVTSVNPRPSEAGDKNLNAIEPLVVNPGGDLRVFKMADLPSDQSYLAPSLERCAAGIGGTHKRLYGAYFDFPVLEDATRLDRAAIVTRVNDQWEIVAKGQMS